MTSITITKPNDLHLHIRDGDIMHAVLPHTAKSFARATIMPNLTPPIITAKQAETYKDQIIKSLEKSKISNFQPLMTTYLTDQSDPNDIVKGFQNNIISAVKMYPANATTNSQFGLTDFFKPKAIYEAMSEAQIPLLIHGEINDPKTDIYDREKLFIDNILTKLVDLYPNLKIVLEHITTEESVNFIRNTDDNIAATITPHHLHINRSDMFAGARIRPHLFCLPIAKREHHRQALIKAATSGKRGFFAGTDSAPHFHTDKESACGCAGIFNAHTALADYAEIFANENALDKLQNFTYQFGNDFYGLSETTETITLTKTPYQVPDKITVSRDKNIIPFRAGDTISWQVE